MPFRVTIQPTLKKLAYFLFWTVLFALAYTQSPLYTSNQNQYFLRGLASAGLGTLNEDWLVKIPDTVPIFNALVEWSMRIFQNNVVFYGYYALFMGIYFFSLAGIAAILFDIRKNRRQYYFFIALLILIHSAAIRFVLTSIADVDWAYVLEDGFADQRMLGPVFEPSVFAVFLLLAVYLFLQRRPYLAALSAALAAIVHPTYLLSAGVLVLGFLVTLYLEERKLKKPILTGLIALAAVAPIMVYSFTTFWGTTPALAAHAQSILVDFRIPHHADIRAWFGAPEAVKIVLIAAGLWLIRKNRLFPLMLTVSLATVVLILAQTVTHSDALALLFPWRPTILLVPLAMTVLLASGVTWLLKSRPALRWQVVLNKWLPWISAALITACVIAGMARFAYELVQKNEIPEQALFTYVADHRATGQVYLIPLKMQDFRLATGAPAYVDFKSIPYTDVRVLDWYSMVLMAGEFYQHPDCKSLQKFLIQARITHVVLENSQEDLNCTGVEKIFQDKSYKLFSVNASLLK
jgi:hypothetical protein